MRTSLLSECLCKRFPKIRNWLRIVEYVTNAKYGIHTVAPRDVEDGCHHVHTRPRQLFLPLLREGRKAPPEVPVGSMQQSQHNVSGLGRAIWNADWNNRVTVGAR